MSKPTSIFFGSFQHYSTKVLEGIFRSNTCDLRAVVTTPNSHTETWAKEQNIPVFTPDTLDETALNQLERPDLFITAGYGKLLPASWLSYPKTAALNLHFSLLPKYRGANPAEWAILMGETETGITLIEMSPSFDTGKIIASAAILIEPQDTRETVYDHLYSLGGEVLPSMIEIYLKDGVAIEQGASPTPYAKRLQRQDGFIDWQTLQQGGLSPFLQEIATLQKLTPPDYPGLIERATRALYNFPSLWTIVPTTKGEKRMKLLAVHTDPATNNIVVDTVHLAGYQPSAYNQIKNLIA